MLTRTAIYGFLLYLLLGLSNTAFAERPWSIAGHLGAVDLSTTSSETLGVGGFMGGFLGKVDDSSTSYGLSLAYRFHQHLGLRLMVERSTGFEMVNRCPPGAVCPAVLIRDRGDLDTWTLALTPRVSLTGQFSLYGLVGVTHWDISTGGSLPGDSSTDFTIGGGIGWQLAEFLEFGLEYQWADFDYNAWRMNAGFRF